MYLLGKRFLLHYTRRLNDKDPRVSSYGRGAIEDE